MKASNAVFVEHPLVSSSMAVARGIIVRIGPRIVGFVGAIIPETVFVHLPLNILLPILQYNLPNF